MFKTLISFALVLFCLDFSFAQKNAGYQRIADYYKAEVSNAVILPDSLKYYLVSFKRPELIDNSQYQPVKRITYNDYIVRSHQMPIVGANILKATAANSLWKASDNLLNVWKKHINSRWAIKLSLTVDNSKTLNSLDKYGVIISRFGNRVAIKTSSLNLLTLLDQDGVLFANTLQKAHAELAIPDIDLGENDISAIADNYSGIDGTGINVSVKEDKYDNDLDLLGRSFSSLLPSSNTTSHATTMATLIGGNGNSYIKGLGAAPSVKFTSSNFANLFPDSTAIFSSFHISVQNHSYGTDIENFYSDESAAYDQQITTLDTLVHVFSAGNIGTSASTTGIYNGIKGYANISGTFKQAKNVLVIGGTDRTDIPESLSSAGPAYDGRILPQLVADGEDGTSGAAALVSGTVALLQQAYKKQFGQLPSSALIKCILINSADNIGTFNVNYKTGYGKLNALEALRIINENRFNKGSILDKQQSDFSIAVPFGCSTFKVSLVWNDLPAAINAPTALINDLDLSVTSPAGVEYLPWTLSSYPVTDSLTKPAYRGKDSLNNTEQVSVNNPAAGVYKIHVKGSRVHPGGQIYYIAEKASLANKFEWLYPAGRDQLFAADSNYLRWQNSYNINSGTLSVSYDHGKTWQLISNINLKNNYYDWMPPDVFTTALLRMDVNGSSQISKEFVISKPLSLQVGYVCSGGTLLHWNAQPGSTGYVIYNIRNNLLQKLTMVTDTSVIIASQQQSSGYFAVSALGNGFEGIKSYTINVTDQGVGCYIRTLLANVENQSILLNLELGSVLNLKSVTWQKLTGPGSYTDLATAPISGFGLNLQFTDNNPKNGVQYYRAALTTNEGMVVYSDIANAIYLQPTQFVVFPNPVSTQLNILSGDINEYEFKLYNAGGRLSIDEKLNELNNTIPITLSPGVYPYEIILKGKVIFKGKMVKI